MREFRIVMDAKFEAEDIDDAFKRLSFHFGILGTEDEDSESYFGPGSSIRIRPSEDFDDEKESNGE